MNTLLHLWQASVRAINKLKQTHIVPLYVDSSNFITFGVYWFPTHNNHRKIDSPIDILDFFHARRQALHAPRWATHVQYLALVPSQYQNRNIVFNTERAPEHVVKAILSSGTWLTKCSFVEQYSQSFGSVQVSYWSIMMEDLNVSHR